MGYTKYSSEQLDLIWDWCEMWLELSALINEVTGNSEPPTDLDQLKYWSFRFWFIDHQREFAQLWNEFSRSHEFTSNQGECIEEVTDAEYMNTYFKNPFAFFYEPKDFYVLAQQLDLQSGIDIWEPSEHRASMMRPMLVRMGEIGMELVKWMNKRTCKSE